MVFKHFTYISLFKTLSHMYCCSHWTNEVNNMFEATWLEIGKIGVQIQVGWLQCSPSPSPPLLFCLSNKALALLPSLPSFLSFSSRWAQLSSCWVKCQLTEKRVFWMHMYFHRFRRWCRREKAALWLPNRWLSAGSFAFLSAPKCLLSEVSCQGREKLIVAQLNHFYEFSWA